MYDYLLGSLIGNYGMGYCLGANALFFNSLICLLGYG
jgi:hypothetical protein